MHPQTIQIRCRAIIIHEGALLTVRHSGKDFLALPGGHLEFGEDPKECLYREVVEELGIAPEIGRVLFVNTFVSVGVQSIEFFFEITNAADYLGLENTHRSHAHEIDEYVWVEPGDDVVIRPLKFAEHFLSGATMPDQTVFLQG